MPVLISAPGPRGKPVIGSLLEFRRDPLGFLIDLARDYGDIAAYGIFNREIFLFNHPDHIKDVKVHCPLFRVYWALAAILKIV